MMMVVSKISKSNHWWLFMYVLEFFLFLIFVFREPSVGTDTINYINDFKYIERAPFNIQCKHPIKYPFSLSYFHSTFACAILHELLTYFHYDKRTIYLFTGTASFKRSESSEISAT